MMLPAVGNGVSEPDPPPPPSLTIPPQYPHRYSGNK